MKLSRAVLPVALCLHLAGPMVVAAPAPSLQPAEVAAFLGTWPLLMTNPEGARETVRIWEENGAVKASVQSGRFPAQPVGALMKDGDLLVLSLSRFENGAPIWAVVALKLEGDTLHMAQMLERSQTIKRGSGKKETATP